jgi:hypothetical protein
MRDETLALFSDVEGFVRRFVVMDDYQSTAVALWLLHAWAIEAADTTLYLRFRSAAHQSGKTRALEVLAATLGPRALMLSSTSAAALFRELDRGGCVLLFDEADNALAAKGSERVQEITGILNAGYRRGGSVARVEVTGRSMTCRRFNVFGAKAIAGVKELAEAIESRSVPIVLRRKLPSEKVERWRERTSRPEAEALGERISAWADRAVPMLADARPDVPDELTDRQADGWEPLLAIADMAGAIWPGIAREAAVALHGSTDADVSLGVLLLAHVRDAFDGCDRLSSQDLLRSLVDREDGPWAGWWGPDVDPLGHGHPVRAASDLAYKLRPFEVRPRKVRVGERTAQGYRREDFVDVWARFRLDIERIHRPDDDPEQVGDVPGAIPAPSWPVPSVPGSEGGTRSEGDGAARSGRGGGGGTVGTEHVSEGEIRSGVPVSRRDPLASLKIGDPYIPEDHE